MFCEFVNNLWVICEQRLFKLLSRVGSSFFDPATGEFIGPQPFEGACQTGQFWRAAFPTPYPSLAARF
jgi:hypothetical protein